MAWVLHAVMPGIVCLITEVEHESDGRPWELGLVSGVPRQERYVESCRVRLAPSRSELVLGAE